MGSGMKGYCIDSEVVVNKVVFEGFVVDDFGFV